MSGKTKPPKLMAGWREWIALPELGIDRIKAKLDVGARTSALHAYDVVPFEENGRSRVRFKVHPLQKNLDYEVECEADLVGRRTVKSSTGVTQERWVIHTTMEIAGLSWPIDVTLTNRRRMRFRMLLGRTGMRGHLTVDPGRSFLTGRPTTPSERKPE